MQVFRCPASAWGSKRADQKPESKTVRFNIVSVRYYYINYSCICTSVRRSPKPVPRGPVSSTYSTFFVGLRTSNWVELKVPPALIKKLRKNNNKNLWALFLWNRFLFIFVAGVFLFFSLRGLYPIGCTFLLILGGYKQIQHALYKFFFYCNYNYNYYLLANLTFKSVCSNLCVEKFTMFLLGIRKTDQDFWFVYLIDKI